MRYRRSHFVRPLMDVVLVTLICFAVLCAGRPAYGESPLLVQQAGLNPKDPVERAQFGWSVAISGDTVVGGAPNSSGPGAAYVFFRTGSGWSQQQKLSPDVARTGFGKSVAISGDTLVVGSPSDSGGGTPSGAAYVFVRTGTAWSLQQRLTASDVRASDQFGSSVAISGETIVVGALGAAYVFVRNASRWSEQQKLLPGDGKGGSFGSSVALDGETAVVGDPALAAGSAYVFARSGTSWSQVQKLTASDAAAAANFGYSVAIRGEKAIIGAPYSDSAGFDSGSAYVFIKDGASWSQQQKLIPADAVPPGDVFGKHFGESVAISDETILVGARHDNSGKGAAYVFGRSGTSWSQAQKLTMAHPAAKAFGLSVALSSEVAAVGLDFGSHAYGTVIIYSVRSNRPPVADAGPASRSRARLLAL